MTVIFTVSNNNPPQGTVLLLPTVVTTSVWRSSWWRVQGPLSCPPGLLEGLYHNNTADRQQQRDIITVINQSPCAPPPPGGVVVWVHFLFHSLLPSAVAQCHWFISVQLQLLITRVNYNGRSTYSYREGGRGWGRGGSEGGRGGSSNKALVTALFPTT